MFSDDQFLQLLSFVLLLRSRSLPQFTGSHLFSRARAHRQSRASRTYRARRDSTAIQSTDFDDIFLVILCSRKALENDEFIHSRNRKLFYKKLSIIVITSSIRRRCCCFWLVRCCLFDVKNFMTSSPRR